MNIKTATTDYITARLAVLQSRRELLSRLPKPGEHVNPSTGAVEDPFEFEIRGAYIGPRSKAMRSQERLDEIASAQLEPGGSLNRRNRVDVGRVMKRRTELGIRQVLTPTRASKRKAYWDDEQDRTLRRCIRKWGWGCWKRIERSGRLPSEYTAKMIANHAKVLNLQDAYPGATGEPDAGKQELKM
jgi:hypothetical protein